MPKYELLNPKLKTVTSYANFENEKALFLKPDIEGTRFEINTPEKKLKKHERGLVISIPISIINDGQGLQIGGGGLDLRFIKSSLLFWDRFDWPENSLISEYVSPDVEFLIYEGIIQRSFAKFIGKGFGGEIVLNSLLSSYKMLDNQNPGCWSLASGTHSISYPETEIDEGRGLLFKLHEAIPVPDISVPFDDILSFKLQRMDELHKLRHHLEEVYQQVLTSTDQDLAKVTQFQKLDKALGEYIRVSLESGMKLSLSGLQAKINLLNIGVTTIASMNFGLPLSAALLTGCASSVSISTGFGLKNKKQSTTPFEYSSTIHKVLG